MKKHRASECASKTSCQHCKRRHHSSICEQRDQSTGKTKKLLTDGAAGQETFPVIVVKVDGVMCRALIDSGAGGSYASTKLIKLIDKKPRETKLQRVDMLMGSKTGRMEFYDVEVSSHDGNYKMDVKLAKVEKPELISINNPGYEKLIRKYNQSCKKATGMRVLPVRKVCKMGSQ